MENSTEILPNPYMYNSILRLRKQTCGVSSLADFTVAWMPSTVVLLAVPTAAAFSAVAPSLAAWFSKFAALSSNTYLSEEKNIFKNLYFPHRTKTFSKCHIPETPS